MSPSSVNKPSFKLRYVSYKETLQEVKSIRSDCSTRNDKIPISLINPLMPGGNRKVTHT